MVQRAVCTEEARNKPPFKQNGWDADSINDHSELINYTVRGYPVHLLVVILYSLAETIFDRGFWYTNRDRKSVV